MEPKIILVKNLVREFSNKLAGLYPEHEIRQMVYMLFEEYLGWPKTKVHLSYDIELPVQVIDLFILALNELYNGKPIQYLLKKTWFNGSLLKVDYRVLVPRPETEELCAMIKLSLGKWQNDQIAILDIGTGSGCIAIDLKKHYPKATVTAIDNSPGTLTIAEDNARVNQCDITFIHADILNQAEWGRLGNFNVIVSNPPYVLESEKRLMHRNVIDFEPGNALFVPDNDPLLFYRAIAGFATTHMVPPARLYFEINEQFGNEVKELLLSYGFSGIQILHDFHEKERFVTADVPDFIN